jgi:hypothetical protein
LEAGGRNPEPPPADLSRIADEITNEMIEERFFEARARFGWLMKLTVSTLNNEPRAGGWSFARFIDFERGRALLTIVLNSNGLCTGLRLVPASVPDTYSN